MKNIAKLLTAALVVAACAFPSNAQAPKAPDFAQPRTAIASADSLLRIADAQHDDIRRLQALMWLGTARTEIDRDTRQASVDTIMVVSRTVNEPQVRSLYDLYAARCIYNIYRANRYQYASRQLASDAQRPCDMAQWDRQMFISVIDSLVRVAWRDAGNRPIADFDGVVVADRLTRRYFPAVADFVAVNIINGFGFDVLSPDFVDDVKSQIVKRQVPGSEPFYNWQAYLDKGDGKGKFSRLFDAYQNSTNKAAAAVVFAYATDIFAQSLITDVDSLGYQKVIETLQSVETSNRGSWLENGIKNIIAKIERPRGDFALPSLLPANTDYCLKLTGLRNLKTAAVEFLGFKSEQLRSNYVRHDAVQPFVRVLVTVDLPEKRFAPIDTTVIVKLPAANYLVGIQGDDRAGYQSTCAVTNLVCAVNAPDKKGAVAVLGADDGYPMANIPVRLKNRNGKQYKSTTGANGIAYFAKGAHGTVSLIEPNGAVIDYDVWVTENNAQRNVSDITTTMTTNQGIYHLGDTVKWLAVATDTRGVLSRRAFEVSLFDSQNKLLQTVCDTTDSYGRIAGQFKLPDEGRTGRFSLKTMLTDSPNLSANWMGFMVSDFKPNAISINSLQAWPRIDGRHQLRLKGRVIDQLARPVNNAAVEAVVEFNDKTANSATISDTRGNFEFIIAYPDTAFILQAVANVTATAPDGNMTHADVTFNPAVANSLTADIPTSVNSSNPLALTPKLLDPAQKAVNETLRWVIKNKNGKIMAHGNIPANIPTSLNLSAFEPGSYQLEISASKAWQARTLTKNINIYNPAVATLPDEDAIIWTPGSDEHQVLVGISSPGAYLWQIDDNHTSAKWYDAGYHSFELATGHTEFVAVRQARSQSLVFDITKPDTTNLRIVTENIRDHVFLPATETWALRVVDANGKAMQAAVALTATDIRLDKLCKPNPLDVKPFKIWQPQLAINMPYNYTRQLSLTSPLKLLDFNGIQPPRWWQSEYMTAYSAGAMPRRNILMTRSNKQAFTESLADAATPQVEEDATESQIDLRITDAYNILWQPSLTTGADGVLAYTMHWPNLLATWHLRGHAWTTEGRMASLDQNIVTAKAVTIAISAPRFVRCTDDIRLMATVTNATDRVQTARATLGIDSTSFNTVKTLELQPFASDTLSLMLRNVNAESLVIRATVIAGDHTDGERVAIPVLPSQAQVYETQNFYLSPADTIYDCKLPSPVGSDFKTSLTYTDNAVWKVVDALPSLTDDRSEVHSAPCQAQRLFAAATMLGLMHQHPELELKYDAPAMRRIVKSAIARLSQLQNPDGGLRWGIWSDQSSQFSTAYFLTLVANLKLSGYLPKDAKLQTILAKAVPFYDRAVKDENMQYAAIRPVFADIPQSLNGKNITAKTVQYALKNWKGMPVPGKAAAATMLWRNDNRKMAQTILSALDQFGTPTQHRGFEFRNVNSLTGYVTLLDAYSAIQPASPRVDGLRQHLIINKQANIWGPGAAMTTAVVSTIINSGTPWTEAKPQPVSISVDSKTIGEYLPVKAEPIEVVLPEGMNLQLNRASHTPAYGAVMATYVAPMDAIKAASDGEVSVTKTLTVQRDGRLQTWSPGQPLRIGDVVNVQLTVVASRPMSEVTITDDRPAALQPVVQLPGWVWADGLRAYRQNRDASTDFFINRLPKGTYVITYAMNVTTAGSFANGLATVTCTQAPTLTAHSAGNTLIVNPR